ncbi:hypothetical protein [Sinorhizobium prairiense]|uniref:hypothetical protein n=1 Tax=unclassified Sinorhizobium TaxID=2613772 RepID=UPI0023D7DFE3|nr:MULTISPECIES: hypothetical protein [unclassified Sinorhizobium]WEJ09073.1 hypothetical protein N0Q90_13100 [Sinorhizobium sp. M103]WEJ16385.1 hypothetical protein N0Q91_07215 [Sinorhizobium sp. K101]WEJ36032.1 hypothetical protein N0R80_13070 [Sinorhizobium sp. C101]
MFIAHLPAGYILTHCIARKNETIRSRALAVGLIFSVLPDLDLLYFFLGDGRRTPHHDYWTHLPIFWLGVAALTAAALILAGKRHSMFVSRLGRARQRDDAPSSRFDRRRHPLAPSPFGDPLQPRRGAGAL